MKTSQDPRHKKRQYLIQELFSRDFQEQSVSKDTQDILKHLTDIDDKIRQAAPDFPVDKINKIDLAVLRLATYELLIEQKEPQNVIIDEAVELAKEFGNNTSPAFINGVLGHIIANAKLT
jgi:N utilization substance protein B